MNARATVILTVEVSAASARDVSNGNEAEVSSRNSCGLSAAVGGGGGNGSVDTGGGEVSLGPGGREVLLLLLCWRDRSG